MVRRGWLVLALGLALGVGAAEGKRPMNVLFIIADDLTATALGCYGNRVCKTPNIDRLAARGMRFSSAFCNATYCGPSRASLMSGYYPHATGLLRYEKVRPAIGKRATWPQHFKNNGYHTARVSKLYHMGIPGDIVSGGHGSDDPESWSERFNSQGPEWQAEGDGETLEKNRSGKRPVVGGNTFVVVEADGDDLVHSDGKTAVKAVELLGEYAKGGPFFLGVGFVRPHVPFVAPRSYFKPYLPYSRMVLPPKMKDAWKDIPMAGINYCTSQNLQMDVRQQKKAVGGYYAAVSYMDAQVGKVLDALEKSGAADNTLVIFTSDHGFHLGEHDFWAKVSLRDESSRVPLIISGPGVRAGVCDALVELLDLYPTTAKLCGLDVPERLQGKDISGLLVNPKGEVREEIFCVAPMRNGFLLRDKRYSYIQYKADASGGVELYDLARDPGQHTNLAVRHTYKDVCERYKEKVQAKLAEVKGRMGG